MKAPSLRQLSVSNFRSIRGAHEVPLDAQVVLIHGENGAGKTSLLSAIELALTGQVVSLQRADAHYAGQLLHRHRDVQVGSVALDVAGLDEGVCFSSKVSSSGIVTDSVLPERLASLFSERCYLPQSLLGQLLQIYQDSDKSPNSPLSRFVNELLGIDRLDSIEAGLLPAADIRNLRKSANALSRVEAEEQRIERFIFNHQSDFGAASTNLKQVMATLQTGLEALGFSGSISERELHIIDEFVDEAGEEMELNLLADMKQKLQPLLVAGGGNKILSSDEELALSAHYSDCSRKLVEWSETFGPRLEALTTRVQGLLPNVVPVPVRLLDWHVEASLLIREELLQATAAVERSIADAQRHSELESQMALTRNQLEILDMEISGIGANSETLSAALSEIAAFVEGENCPLCDRDFGELGEGSLIDHVHSKVRSLSGAAERLLLLSKNRAAQAEHLSAMSIEVAEIHSRRSIAPEPSEMARKQAALQEISSELSQIGPSIVNRQLLLNEEGEARRNLTDHQAFIASRQSSVDVLNDIGMRLGMGETDPLMPAAEIASNLLDVMEKRLSTVRERLKVKRMLLDTRSQARVFVERRETATSALKMQNHRLATVKQALNVASTVRENAQTIRRSVESVRSAIIGREFNNRLNQLWRDLFIRLAPNEPFIPAFQIPRHATSRLQPKLITKHRSGGAGGTPGAMLSAGNLNTAALTLFVALHLTVDPQLPWLILDDPVQSMDDVHIAHFASLLRTLAKQQRRQVVVAVHDRQLFEYLRLELSPSAPNDSLLTLELARGFNSATSILPKRVPFQEETFLRVA